MSEEEELRRQYRKLYRKLRQIGSELDNIKSTCYDMYNIANSTVRIDKKVVEDDKFKFLKNKNQKVIDKLSNTMSRVERRF